MPTFTRTQLRQKLGQTWLRDTLVGTTTSGSWGASGSVNVIDRRQADPSLSEDSSSLYNRAWLRVNGMTLRVASFNTGSGAFLSAQYAATTVASGMAYEVHERLSPDEKDRVLTEIVQSLRWRQDVALPSIDGEHIYTLPDYVTDVLDASALDANGSERAIRWFGLGQNASGTYLKVAPTLGASGYLVLDALVTATLGADDTATISLPDDDWVCAGAAARCFWLLEQKSPGQEAAAYKEKRTEARRAFALKQQQYQPVVSRRFQMEEPF